MYDRHVSHVPHPCYPHSRGECHKFLGPWKILLECGASLHVQRITEIERTRRCRGGVEEKSGEFEEKSRGDTVISWFGKSEFGSTKSEEIGNWKSLLYELGLGPSSYTFQSEVRTRTRTGFEFVSAAAVWSDFMHFIVFAGSHCEEIFSQLPCCFCFLHQIL